MASDPDAGQIGDVARAGFCATRCANGNVRGVVLRLGVLGNHRVQCVPAVAEPGKEAVYVALQLIRLRRPENAPAVDAAPAIKEAQELAAHVRGPEGDRKSPRLNSSHY